MEHRSLHARRLRQAVPDRSSVVLPAECHRRPSVIQAAPDDVDLVAAEWSVLRLPQLASFRMEREPVRIAMTVAPDLGPRTRASDERVVVRYSAIVVQPYDLA